MKFLRVVLVIFFLAGVAAIFFSNYIMAQVGEGKTKITEGEQTMKAGEQLFSLNPVSKEVGGQLSNRAQKKFAEGKEQIAQYTAIAQQLYTGGVILAVIGAGGFLVSLFFKSKKRR